MTTQTPTNQLFEQHNLRNGRLLGYSKSVYRFAYPNDEVHFNANVFTDSGKVWYGDLNLTLDGKTLEKIAKEAKCKLYVLREYEGRFLDKPIEDLIKLAVKTYGE